MKLNKKSIIAILLISFFCVATLQAADVTVKLEWDANPEADLAGYRIYWGTESRTTRTGGGYANFIDVGNKTTGDVFPLQDNTRYFFAATAYDTAANESNYSSEVTYKTADVTAPGQVINLRVTMSVKFEIVP